MRILYHHRIASKDGQITHIEEMVEALRSQGHEVSLVGPDAHHSDTGQGGSAGWVGMLKRALPATLYELAEAAYALVVYRRLRRAVAAIRPDVIYERYALYQPAGIWVSRRTGVPLLLEVNAPYAIARRRYGQLRLGWLADRIERFTFRGATRVFPVTRVLGDMLVAAGVDGSRIRVIPNGINPENFRQLPSLDEAKARLGLSARTVIGFIGFVREWDRLDRVVDWLKQRPPHEAITLLIVGDGPVRSALEAQAARLGIPERLKFTGVVPRTDVPAAAMAFDVALQTALVPYASPLCLFEYMALGKAIVAPDQPNHHEVLVQGVDCEMYDPDADQAIEACLDKLVADPERRARLGTAARQALQDRQYLWQGNARRVATEAALVVGPARTTATGGAGHA